MTLRVIIRSPNHVYDENEALKPFLLRRIKLLFTFSIQSLTQYNKFVDIDNIKNIDDFEIYQKQFIKNLNIDDYLKYVKEKKDKLKMDEAFFEILKTQNELGDYTKNKELLHLASCMYLIFSKYRLDRNQFNESIRYYELAKYYEGAARYTLNDSMIPDLKKELGVKEKQEIGRKGGQGKARKNDPQKQIVYAIWDQKPRKYHSADKCAEAIVHDERLTVGARTIANWIRKYEKNKKTV